MYSIYVYKSLLVNVSVSLIVSEVLPHMTVTLQRSHLRVVAMENVEEGPDI